VSETLGNLPESLGRSVHGSQQLVGVLGLSNNAMPGWLYVVAGTVYLALLGGALWLATGRERWILVSTVVLALATSVLLDAATQLPYDYSFQARFALPITVFVPVLCGAVIGERSRLRASMGEQARRREAVVLASISLLLFALLALGWWATSRHAAVGLDGPWFFVAGDLWAPPTGWAVPIALCAVGIGTLIVAAVVNAAPSRLAARDRVRGASDTASGPV
jgi:hypothetical protein